MAGRVATKDTITASEIPSGVQYSHPVNDARPVYGYILNELANPSPKSLGFLQNPFCRTLKTAEQSS